METKGFQYYAVVTDRYQDKRIKRLKKVFGPSGIAIYDYILCEIYRVKGCFIEWDEGTAFDVADYFGVKENLVNEIVNYCCAVGLFDKELLARERVLSSRSIQVRYIYWSIKARRKGAAIPEHITLIPEEGENVQEEVEEMYEEIGKMNEEKDKVKESKVKKSKVFTPPTAIEVIEFFKEKGFPEDHARRAWEYYDSAGWVDSKGNQVRNWKQKFIANWMKESDKTKSNGQATTTGSGKTITEKQSSAFKHGQQLIADFIAGKNIGRI